MVFEFHLFYVEADFRPGRGVEDENELTSNTCTSPEGQSFRNFANFYVYPIKKYFSVSVVMRHYPIVA